MSEYNSYFASRFCRPELSLNPFSKIISVYIQVRFVGHIVLTTNGTLPHHPQVLVNTYGQT